jgi:hypothetical protein
LTTGGATRSDRWSVAAPGFSFRRVRVRDDAYWEVREERARALLGEKTKPPRGSYWCGDLVSQVLAEPGDEVVLLRGALERLAPSGGWLRSFRRSGGRVEVYLWLNDWEVGGLGLPTDVLASLVRLGAELSIEFV